MRLPRRSLLAALHDSLMAALSLPCALYLRLGESEFHLALPPFAVDMGIFMLCFVGFSLLFRLPKEVWRYVSLGELSTIIKVVSCVIIVSYLVMFFVNRLEGVPRSVPVLHWMVLMALLSTSRLLYRTLRERASHPASHNQPLIPVVLVGANDHSEAFIRTVQRRRSMAYRVVGIVDNNPLRAGRTLRGIPIYGDITRLHEIISTLEAEGNKPQRVILSEEYVEADVVESLLDICAAQGVSLARLPRLTDLQEGMATKQELRPIVIEDLLNRPQSHHDSNAMQQLIRDRVILVTGAGGSIGSELARQIASNHPMRLIILDNSEHNLYQIDRELSVHFPGISRLSVLADIRDMRRMQQLMSETNPQIVFHAAALKHVPIAEENPEETILTNVYGTRNVARAAALEGVEAFVLVSTDKAVHPANVMGASKRLAELVCASISAIAPELRMVIVRFGNVLGSTGSVVPLFQEQLNAGGPLTVTHPDMERYFMTIREASGLVIQAAAQSSKGIALYILDMGKPVRILTLAEQMIRLAGFTPNKDVHIRFTGLRAGEKLREELVYGKEPLSPTHHPKIMRTRLHTENMLDDTTLTSLEESCHGYNSDMVIRLLQDAVPEYRAIPHNSYISQQQSRHA